MCDRTLHVCVRARTFATHPLVIVYIVGGNCKYDEKLSKKAIANTSHPSCRHDFQLLSALRSALSACWAKRLAALLRKKENKWGIKCSVFVHKFWTHFIVIMVSPKFHVQKRNFLFNLFKPFSSNWYMLQKKCEKCLEAENIPLTDLLFYILEVLDPCSYKSSHLAM